jgi:superfamily II DNA or RNA helicase
VTNDDKDAGDKIRRFKEGTTPWLVSVKMVSEGVDIPRLRVGVYLSPVQTEMFFRQAAGRLVRLVPDLEEQAGYLYIPSLPRLVDFAAAMTDERRHAIAKKGPGNGGHPTQEEGRPEREEPSDMDYRFLAAVGERAGVVETSAPTSKDGQTFFDFAADLVDDEPEPVTAGPAPLLGELKSGVRRKGGTLSSLVNDLYRTHKVAYAHIHAHLNGLQKVSGQSQCTLEQLEQREDLLRVWLSSGKPPTLQRAAAR